MRYSDWRPALTADGQVRRGAHVAEIGVVPDWMPAGTRGIVRRERPHPGAPLKLWDHNGWRHQVIVTNQPGDAVELERGHRQHAQVENRIKQLKDLGDARFPFTRLTANAGWLETMLIAALLLAATRSLLLDGELAEAEPRRLRHTLLGCPARLVRRARQTWLRLPDSWPWTHQLLPPTENSTCSQPRPPDRGRTHPADHLRPIRAARTPPQCRIGPRESPHTRVNATHPNRL